MKKLLTALVVVALAAGVAAVFRLQHRAGEKLRAENRALASLNEQMTHLRVENEQRFPAAGVRERLLARRRGD